MKMNEIHLMITIIIIAIVPSIISYGTFPIKYKGNYLSLEEYNKLELCSNKWCLDDANRIIEEISYNDTVEPCEDFSEFVCGTFFKERALNERYEYIGFRRNYELKLDEEQHKALKASIDEKDGKAVKVTKNFYQRCINSRYIEKNSRKEILDYLSSFGKFPIQKPDWTEADLNFTKLLTETKLEYFFNFEITFAPRPFDGIEMLGVIPEYFHSLVRYVSSDFIDKDVSDMYKLMKFSTSDIKNLIKDLKEAALKHSEVGRNEETFSVGNIENFIGTLNELSRNLSQFGLHELWIDIFNNQLVESLRVKGDAMIFVSDFTEFKSRLQVFLTMSKRLIANSIMIDILYDYRNLFEVYAFENKKYKTAIKTPQRFEICNGLLQKLIPVPTRAIFARRYLTDEAKNAAKVIMDIAITSHLHEIEKLNNTTPEYVVRIKEVKAIAGYPIGMTDDMFLDRIYANLPLTGNETLFETFRELARYQKFTDFMNHSREDFLTLNVGKATGNNAFSCLFATNDLLYCPATALRYPVFHPQRSQFYNMAMLLPEIYQVLYTVDETAEDKAFRDYQSWVEVNGVDSSLPGFLLTNEQMFWVALKLKTCIKGGLDNIDFESTIVSSRTGLKEAFNCSARNDTHLLSEMLYNVNYY